MPLFFLCHRTSSKSRQPRNIPIPQASIASHVSHFTFTLASDDEKNIRNICNVYRKKNRGGEMTEGGRESENERVSEFECLQKKTEKKYSHFIFPSTWRKYDETKANILEFSTLLLLMFCINCSGVLCLRLVGGDAISCWWYEWESRLVGSNFFDKFKEAASSCVKEENLSFSSWDTRVDSLRCVFSYYWQVKDFESAKYHMKYGEGRRIESRESYDQKITNVTS